MEPESKNLISNHCKNFAINQDRFDKILNLIQSSLRFASSYVDLSFVDNETIRELNHDHRGKDSATDVLSFPQWNWLRPVCVGEAEPLELIKETHIGEDLLLGDVVICPAMANQNAKKINQPLEREITFLMVHGILHLCGHDHQDKDEQQVMNTEQQRIMEILENVSAWTDLLRRPN